VARLVRPQRADAQGATGAGCPPGRNLLLVPAARRASAVLRSQAWSDGGGVGGIHKLEGEGEEVAQEEEGEVPEVSRRLYLKGATGVVTSNLGAGIEASAQYSTVKRRAIMTIRRLGDCSVARRFISPAVATPRVRDLCFFTWSSDRTVDACRWRAQQLLGPPALRSLQRARSRAGLPGATVGVLDTGVSWSTCSWALSSAHL
jgi:hypothetical protein